MANKFKAVAYYMGDNLIEDWPVRAAECLKRIPGGIAEYSSMGAGVMTLEIQFPDGALEIIVASGKMQGSSVKPSPAAGVLVLCLVALRKFLGGIEIVDDSQATVPSLVRQSNPLYGADWARVEALAEALGFLGGKKIFASNPELRARLF